MNRVALFVLALVLVACTAPVKRVATSMNAYDAYEARYEEGCAGKGPLAVGWTKPKDCAAMQADLIAWKKHLEEANRAVKNGGKCPLQLKQIARDEKEVERAR